MRPRRLIIINPEDEEANRTAMEKYTTHFIFQPIKGAVDALNLFSQLRIEDPIGSNVDIVLLDVNMEKDREKAGFNWGTGNDLAPYGPLLALPFIKFSPLTRLIPYSMHWDKPEVNRNGYVLLALAFMFSAIERSPVRMQDVQRRIQQHSDPKLPDEALRRALREYRTRLLCMAESKELLFLGLDETLRDLVSLTRMDSSALRMPLLKPGAEQPISIDFQYTDTGRRESLVLSSVFADSFNFLDQARTEDIKIVEGVIRKWPNAKARLWPEESLIQTAVDVLIECRTHNFESTDRPDRGNIFSRLERANKFPKGLSPVDKRLIIRTVVLFAWVVAWYRFRHSGHELMKSILEIFDRDANQDPTNFYHSYASFLGSRNKVFYDKLYATPLSSADPSNRQFVRLSYSLLEDKPGYLLEYERDRCLTFAKKEIEGFFTRVAACVARQEGGELREAAKGGWHFSQKYPYPEWMISSELHIMQKGLQKERLSEKKKEQRKTKTIKP